MEQTVEANLQFIHIVCIHIFMYVFTCAIHFATIENYPLALHQEFVLLANCKFEHA